jgi:hypothetical protein
LNSDHSRCHLCLSLVPQEALEEHAPRHRYRECSQELFYSWDAMRQHLVEFHFASGICQDESKDFENSALMRHYSGYTCAADPRFAEEVRVSDAEDSDVGRAWT